MASVPNYPAYFSKQDREISDLLAEIQLLGETVTRLKADHKAEIAYLSSNLRAALEGVLSTFERRARAHQ